jgi:N6-L-threonylcarbamoyladenine synthase
MLILGIETSCDETAAAVVEDGRRILSSVVASQVDIHHQFGGVVPELASRKHIEAIVPVVQQALTEANTGPQLLDAVAATQGLTPADFPWWLWTTWKATYTPRCSVTRLPLFPM